jgi:hypothetical protein
MTSSNVQHLAQTLKTLGVRLERKPEGGVRVHSPHPLEPELLEAVKTHKLEILAALEQPKTRTLEKLPFELERLIAAASNGALPSGSFTLESGIVPDLERYVLAWCAGYVLGESKQALSRLWEVHKVWIRSRSLN